jgi:hypothetical protein
LLCAWVPNRTLGLFWFFVLRLGTKQNIGFVLVFCFALGYQTEHWVSCGRARAIEWRAEKEEKLIRFFSSLELLRKVLRAKCNNAGLQARADCVRPSQVPTSIMSSYTTLEVRRSKYGWKMTKIIL